MATATVSKIATRLTGTPADVASAVRDRRARAVGEWVNAVRACVAGKPVDLERLAAAGDTLRVRDVADEFAADCRAVEDAERLHSEIEAARVASVAAGETYSRTAAAILEKKNEIMRLEDDLREIERAGHLLSFLQAQLREAHNKSPRVFAAEILAAKTLPGEPAPDPEQLFEVAAGTAPSEPGAMFDEDGAGWLPDD